MTNTEATATEKPTLKFERIEDYYRATGKDALTVVEVLGLHYIFQANPPVLNISFGQWSVALKMLQEAGYTVTWDYADDCPSCEKCGVYLNDENKGLDDEHCQECWEEICSKGWWALVERAEPKTDSEHIRKELRNRPTQIRSLSRQLKEFDYQIHAVRWRDDDSVSYDDRQREVAELQRQRDAISIECQFARDSFNAAIAEARLIGGQKT